MSAKSATGSVVVGVTGASGAIYAHRLVEFLIEAGVDVLLSATRTGKRVIQEEIPHLADPREIFRFSSPRGPRIFPESDVGAPFCSGSFHFRGMVIIPASMGSVGAIAAGIGTNCIQRGADVALKERRKLILVPRETPLSTIHLENLLTLARAGAVVLPACPAFYQGPETIADQVDFIVSRILDHLGVENQLHARWKGEAIRK